MSKKFAEPDVDEDAVELVEKIVKSEGPMEAWAILDGVTEAGVKRDEGRKALRALKLSHKIVPAGDFTGKLRLVEGC